MCKSDMHQGRPITNTAAACAPGSARDWQEQRAARAHELVDLVETGESGAAPGAAGVRARPSGQLDCPGYVADGQLNYGDVDSY